MTSTSPDTKSVGRFKLTEQKFLLGSQEWHLRFTIPERQQMVDRLMEPFQPTQKNPLKHHRMPELRWFARKTEDIFYEKSDSRFLYLANLEKIVAYLTIAIQNTEDLRTLRERQDIPSTDRLEELFTLKCERYEMDNFEERNEYLPASRSREVALKMMKFRSHYFDLTTDSGGPIVIMPKKKRRKDSSEDGEDIIEISLGPLIKETQIAN